MIRFILFLLWTFLGYAEIVEIKSISEIGKKDLSNSLVIFDIDNTLIEPCQTLGSDQWFFDEYSDYKKAGKEDEFWKKIVPAYVAINFITSVKLVEEGSIKLVERLQNSGFLVIAMTSRPFDMFNPTLSQLKSVDIDFSKEKSFKDDFFVRMGNKWLYFKNGILFTDGSHKGESLFKLLDSIHFDKIQKVVYINDKKEPLLEVESLCQNRDIAFLGFRYGFLDEKVKEFNKKTAEIQLQHFRLISDKEAFSCK